MLLLVVSTAQAAPGVDPPIGRQLFDQARAAYDAGRYREAAEVFQRLYALQPLPALLFNEAQAWRRDFELTGQRDSARRAFELYRRYLAAPHVNEQDRREATEHLAALSSLFVEQAATPPPRRRTGLWVGVGVGVGAAVALAVGLGVGLGVRGDAPAPSLVARW